MCDKEEKKRRKSSLICFHNFSVNYERRGGELIKIGVQIVIFKFSNLELLKEEAGYEEAPCEAVQEGHHQRGFQCGPTS